MKKIQGIIEMPRVDLHPEHRLSHDEMGMLTGGAGCICDKNAYIQNGACICNKKKFGLCSKVNGGGSGAGDGCTSYDPYAKPCPKFDAHVDY